MNQEDIKKAMDLIDQSSSFGILLPETPDFDTLAAAEALISMIASLPVGAVGDQKAQKMAGLLSPAALPTDTDQTVFPKLTSPTPLLKEFIISIDTSHAPVSQLRYEKPDNLNRIDIILTPKLSSLGKEQVSFREGAIRCDCLIAIGIPNVKHLSNIADFPPDFFTETRLINIDTSNTNAAAYGEANVVDTSRASRSELVWQMLARFTETRLPDGQAPTEQASQALSPLPAHASTLLLAGILSATAGLMAPAATADAFAAVADLMRLGAKHADAQKMASHAGRQAGGQSQQLPLNLLQLCARASVRSKQDERDSILWSFLTLEDFAKTNRTADDVPTVLKYIRTTLPKNSMTVLLWQDPSDYIRADASRFDRDESGHGGDPQSNAPIRVLLTGDRQTLDAIANKEQTGEIQQGIRLTASFPSFRDAEEHVRSLIRTAP